MYDVIGDIHGHADALVRLLTELGYRERGDCWRHPEREVVFLGDFVDRGPEIAEVLRIAKGMVDGGTARAVMGNHEFNAIAFHMDHPHKTEGFLRERSYKNIRQYLETVRQLGDDELDAYATWFMGLPLWLELDGLRIVHACWDPASMELISARRAEIGGNGDAFFHEACEDDNELFEAVETVLKGKEAPLPEGVSFPDKDGHQRHRVRTRWFEDPAEKSFRDYAFSFRDEEREAVPDLPLTPEVIDAARPYRIDEPPVFFGHYWMPADGDLAPVAPNAACLDYSVARGGKLCAYRWNGERELRADAFVAVPAER